MKSKPFITLYALISIVFGLGFVIAPGLLLSIYGAQTDATFDFVSQLFGAALVSLAALTWLLRGAPASDTRQIIVLSLLVGEALAFILSLISQINGIFNPLGWSAALVYGLFSAGFAYLFFVKPGDKFWHCTMPRLVRSTLVFFAAMLGVWFAAEFQQSAAHVLAAVEEPEPGAWRHYYYENRFFDPLVVSDTLWMDTDVSLVRWNLDDMTYLSYTRVDGLPDDRTRPIAVGPDGALWFASTQGLAHFDNDGWQILTEADGLASNAIASVAFDDNDRLWVAYGIQGAGFYDGANWQHFTVADGLAHNHTNDLAIDQQGNVWLATFGGLSRYDGAAWQTYTTTHGLLENFCFRLEIDADGHLWVIHSSGVSEFDGVNWTTYTDHLFSVIGSYVDADNVKWFGSYEGAVRYDGQSWQVITPPGGFGGRVTGISQSVDGCHLFTTENGFFRWCGNDWEHLWLPSPLPSNTVRSLAIGQDGTRWFGSEGGIAIFDGIEWRTITDTQSFNSIYDLSIDAHNRPWAASSFGAYVYSGTQWLHYTTADGLADNLVFAITPDNRGQVWFGTLGGVSVYTHSQWTTYTTTHGLAGNIVQAVAVDHAENAWFGTTAGLSRFDGQSWQTFTTTHGLLANEIYSLAVDPNGNLWAGTAEGVNIFDGQSWITYTTADGIPHWYIHAITFDAAGTPWVGTGVGIAYLEGDQWHALYPYGSVHYGNTRDLAFDANGHLWLADGSGGVFEYLPGAIEGLVTPDSGGQLSEGDRLAAAPPASASGLPDNLLFPVRLSFAPGAVTADLDLLFSPVSGADMSSLTGVIRSFELYGLAGGTSAPPVAETTGAFTIQIQYTASTAFLFDEASLQLYTWDSQGWNLEPTQALDLEANTLTASPTRLTHFALVGRSNPDHMYLYFPILVR